MCLTMQYSCPHWKSSCSSGLYSSKKNAKANQKQHRCIIDGKWAECTLDSHYWEDENAPVVHIRRMDRTSLDDMEYCGILSDRMIGANSSYLTKSPESGLYILAKCILRRMFIRNISLLYFHRYLQYVDLSYNEISNLMPLGGIPYLVYLNVSHNHLKQTLRFKSPWFLTYVNLSYNHISRIDDLSDYWSIVRLDLSHNAIETISGLENLKYLQHLNLSYNLIECIEKLDKLNIQELNLEGNCISSFKSNTPGRGMSVLPNLRTILLSYNRLSSLEFFKDAYSLHVIDLRFNRIADLLEVSNLRYLIYELDLRGNPCTRWPNYRDVLLFSLPNIMFIDGTEVSAMEKVSASTVFAPSVDLLAARNVTKLTLLEQLNAPTIGQRVTPYDQFSPPLIVLTGPSAVRKMDVALSVIKRIPKKLKYCQWHTTEDTIDNKDERNTYISVKREEFNEMTRQGDFFAVQELLGHSYGFHAEQIVSLVLEKKIGITHTDLHTTMQLRERYPNVKSVLVLVKDEDTHQCWIQEKFNVFTWIKDSIENLMALKIGKYVDESDSETTVSKLNFIEEIIDEVMRGLELPSYSMVVRPQGTGATTTDIILESKTMLPKVVKTQSQVEEEEKRHISFQNSIDDITEKAELLTQEKSRSLKVILDEESNIIIEDADAKRRRQHAKLLCRRSTTDPEMSNLLSIEELSESISSDETSFDTFHKKSKEKMTPADLKEMYTKLVMKSRKLYVRQHLNNPGFFSLVLLMDDFVKASDTLNNFVHELYVCQSFQKPRSIPEIKHLKQVANPIKADEIKNEMRGFLSTPWLQRQTLSRMHGVSSWKKLMPSQLSKDINNFVNGTQGNSHQEPLYET